MRASTKAMLVVVGGVTGADCGQDALWCKRADWR